MEKIIATTILLTLWSLTAYCQDTTIIKSKNNKPYVKDFGPYTVTMNNGHVTLTKNPHYDWSKAIQRQPPDPLEIGIFEIYTNNSDTPIIKSYLIYDVNSIVSDSLMSKIDRIKKYHSRAGVVIVYLKPGVVMLKKNTLLNEFNVLKKDRDLPLYVDFMPIAKPNELLAIANAVLKIDKVTDGDGFKFLNITTKEWVAELKENENKGVIMYIK